MTGFDGFRDDARELLRELPERDRDWFAANKKRYDMVLAQPVKAFVDAVGDLLRERISPEIVAIARVNQSISPINRDTRFSADKTLYKDHLLLRFWEGGDKKTAPILMIRLGADDVGFATGMSFPDVDRWRELVADDATGASLTAAIETISARVTDVDIAGHELKRVPRPWPADHPRGDLLRHRLFQLRWAEPIPDCFGDASFAEWCVERLELCAGVHRWFVDHLT